MKPKFALGSISGILFPLLVISGCEKKAGGPIATSTLYGYVTHATDGAIQGAEVRVQQMVDQTDSNGYYQLQNVPQGSQRITCSHPDYNSFTQDVFISSLPARYDIILTKTVYRNVYVEEDASIRWESPDQNCGQTTVLGIWYNDSLTFRQKQRCFVALPALPTNLPSSALKSAALRLEVKKMGIDITNYPLSIRQVTSPWSEDQITWNNSPQVSSSVFKTLNPQPQFLDIDVLSIYQNFPTYQYGIRIAFKIDEEEGHQPTTIYYKFWSSEGPEPNRPFVALKYIY